ncbi:MAG TPA: response regulator [Gemmataceae bacterium]|nr:response regulator [Gemmataceae bacterium]
MIAQPLLGKTILVIEDDIATREALALFLGQEGCQVLCAVDGRQALHLLRHGPRPDLILLDLMLPGMDGWQFRRQQQRDPYLASIPVVVVSAAGDLKGQARALGAVSLMSKPVELDHLLAEVRRFATLERPGVLVVEDESQVRAMLGVALHQHGFTTWLASNGREAVERYQQHHEQIGVVLLDVQMPGLDGPWTLVALHRINPQVRCCFMSGNTGEYDAEMLLGMGATAVFQKPFGLNEVTQALQQLLG